MPLINGTYQPDTLMDPKTAQKQVFGEYTRKDMSDYSTAAYNYLMKQQEQAFNLQLWNLQNEYNTPAAQMQRFQDAGLNPNLIYSQQNAAAAPSAASASSFRPSGSYSKAMQTGLNAISQVMNTVKAARETYDYVKYGRESSNLANQLATQRILLTSNQETAQKLANDWEMWLQGRMNFDPNAPGVKMYKTQQEAKEASIAQIRQLIAASVTGQARTNALKELDDYRLKMLQGQNDAVLNIHTGLGDSFDAFLKTLVYLAMSKL